MTEARVVLQTPRLILRRWTTEDLEALAALNGERDVMRFFLRPLTCEESRALLERFMRDQARRGFALWALERKADCAFLGFVGLDVPRFAPDLVEILWRLARPSEAARAVLRAVFDESGALADMNLTRIVSFTARVNKRSERVMQRIGMRHVPESDFLHPAPPAEHRLAAHVFYAVERDAWRADDVRLNSVRSSIEGGV